MAKPPPLTEVLTSGRWGTVVGVVRHSGDVPVVKFLDEMPAQPRAYFINLFQLMANFGRIQPKRFKKEMGDFWAFKGEVGNLQYRFPCFRDGSVWVITHGFIKPGARNRKLGEWPEQQVERAGALRAEYLERKRAAGGGGK